MPVIDSHHRLHVAKPPYDAEVEYLESTGTQWIVTPMKFKDFPNAVIKASYGLDSGNSTNVPFWGAYASSNNGYNYASAGSSSCGWSLGSASTSFMSLGTVKALRTQMSNFVVDVPNNRVYLNGVETINKPLTAWNGLRDDVKTSSSIFYLFRDGRSRTTYMVGLKIGTMSCSLNGTMLFDYISVRKDGVGYFYDKVSKTLVPISGSGAFILGSDKSHTFYDSKIYIPTIYKPGFTYRLVCENSYIGKHFYCTSLLDGERVYSTWEITSGSQYATINNNGRVDIVSGTSNQTITVKCSYPYQGETLERTKDITISYDNQLRIECADTLVGTSGNAIARYNDQIVTPSWSIVGTGATIDGNGTISITASGTVVIHATYNNLAVSKTVNLDYVANKSSTTTVDENGSVTTTTTETIVNQDGSTTDTSTSVTVHEDGSVSNTSSETTTQEDGSSTTTSTTTNQDGTSSQTEIQGNADGSSTSTTNEYNADGDMTKTINGEIDTSGNESTQNIEYDDEGTATVTGYSIDTSGNEDGTKTFNKGGVNTEFYGFDAVDGFELDLHFKFDFTAQPANQQEGHHQILCMKRANPSPWYGFQIRQSNTTKQVILGTQFATGSNTNTNLPISWVVSNKIAEYNIHIKYDPTLTSNTFVATNLMTDAVIYRSSNKFPDLPELRYLTVCLGYALDENGNPYRYSNVDILNFNLVKIANA